MVLFHQVIKDGTTIGNWFVMMYRTGQIIANLHCRPRESADAIRRGNLYR